MTPRQLNHRDARLWLAAARTYFNHCHVENAFVCLRKARRYVRLAQMARDIERVRS